MMHAVDNKTISTYLDNRFDAGKFARIRAHIADCPACLEKAAAFQLGKKMLSSLAELEMPQGFDFEFNRRLNEAIAARESQPVLERVVQQFAERIKNVIAPPVPALAKITLSILFIIGIAVGTPYYFSKSPINIAGVSGKVEIYSSQSHKWVLASREMSLAANDVVRTGPDSQIDVGVSGLYTIRMKSNAELKSLSMLPRFRKGLVSYEVARGEVMVDITENFKGSRFEIYTPQAKALALGTKFDINVSGSGRVDKTWLAVLNGVVEVEGRAAAGKKVFVRAGEKTEVLYDNPPLPPSLLIEREWEKLKELYQIGQRTKVILLISATESRVREFLKPCSIYIYDVEPRSISERLEKTVEDIAQAISEENAEKHLAAIRELEMIIEEAPEREYNPQLLLFIGTYYEYMSLHKEAIAVFEKVINNYPRSQFASLAQCAIGIIYKEKLGEKASSRRIFEQLISNYPNSLEVMEAKKGLKELNS